MGHGLANIARLKQPRVLVVGDLILDRYTWGNADRVSPEAPVLVLDVDRREARLGGAGSVAGLLRALEAEVTLAGVVGGDGGGSEVQRLLCEAEIDYSLVDVIPERPTTTKERLIGRASHRHPHQILRVDTEVRTPLDESWQSSMLQRLQRVLSDFDVLLISDYAKGVCPPEFLHRLIGIAREQSIPVIVDPARHPGYGVYKGATILTPNRNEASLGVGWAIETRADGVRAGEQLCERHDFQGVVVKLDGDGMVVVRRDGASEIYSARRRAVYDVTGAGDMVLAMLGLGLASELSLEEAAELANVAAGLQVERLGVAPVFRSEIEDELQRDEFLEFSANRVSEQRPV